MNMRFSFIDNNQTEIPDDSFCYVLRKGDTLIISKPLTKEMLTDISLAESKFLKIPDGYEVVNSFEELLPEFFQTLYSAKADKDIDSSQ